jgi:surface protein
MRKVKKTFRLLFVVLSVLVVFAGKAIAQTPYCLFDEKTGTLTLGYGETLPEGAVEVSEVVSDWKYIGENITSANNVKKVVFDNSFAGFKPTTCALWFCDCSNLTEIQYIGNLKTDNVTNMSGMFSDCSSLTSLDVSNFKTDNVTKMSGMFSSCSSLTSLDVSNFKTDNVTDMSGMFSWCSGLTSLDVSNFKTDNVTNMGGMFSNCSSLTSLDLSNFKTDNVTDMMWMFEGCDVLKTIYVGDNWNTNARSVLDGMFYGCNNLYGGKGTKYDSEKTDKTYARIDGGEENPGYFTEKAIISIKTFPTKTQYFEGEDIDLSGGKILLSYKISEDEIIDMTNEKVTFSKKNNTIEILYNGEKIGEFEVFLVKAKSAVSISITISPKKTEYIKGEKLDVSEGEITVKYDNGDKETVDLSVAEISGFDRNKVGKQTLTVEYQGLTTTFDVEVEQENIVPKPENPETATDDISVNSNVKIWSNEKTIFVENGSKEIQIFDMNGRTVKTVKSDTDRVEIPMSKSGIYIVKTGVATQKVIIQ